MKTIALTLAACAIGIGAAAQPPAAGAANLARFGRAVKARYDTIKRDLEAAEAMPESEYGFRATTQVRSFGEIIGHVADSQNFFCASAAGDNPEYADPLEKSAGAKAALVKALKDSVAACDAVYAATDASNALALVRSGGRRAARHDAARQRQPRQRALRQPGDLHALEGPRPPVHSGGPKTERGD